VLLRDDPAQVQKTSCRHLGRLEFSGDDCTTNSTIRRIYEIPAHLSSPPPRPRTSAFIEFDRSTPPPPPIRNIPSGKMISLSSRRYLQADFAMRGLCREVSEQQSKEQARSYAPRLRGERPGLERPITTTCFKGTDGHAGVVVNSIGKEVEASTQEAIWATDSDDHRLRFTESAETICGSAPRCRSRAGPATGRSPGGWSPAWIHDFAVRNLGERFGGVSTRPAKRLLLNRAIPASLRRGLFSKS